jgi:hypothetical protein
VIVADTKRKNQVILAEFDGPEDLLGAARRLRSAGYRKFDCHSPFPIHGMNSAMGDTRSHLGFIVGSVAAVALIGAYYMQMWMSAVDYRVIISGKPFNSFQAYTPVTFALTVLFSAFAAFIGSLLLNKLPRYYHPVFNSKNFERATDDAFFVSIESTDPKFDIERTRELLESIGGRNVEILE